MKNQQQHERFNPDLDGQGKVHAPVRKRHLPTQSSLKGTGTALAHALKAAGVAGKGARK
ncbi:hypothetical protein ABIC83_002386 [Roseateles asaccharophilus]|uniref:hypothetical protein n=1 Tax=Roseateles asaccharophilus TaxID=582607 RepID=UPI003837EF6B